jgi:hypothetical protein
MLEGLDAVAWADLSHAYGPAVDTPDLLRQAASHDQDLVDAAISDLYGSIFHQGTVYPASAAAVPFLVELAYGAAHQRADFLWFVGSLADDEHADGRSAAAVRAAVAAVSGALAGLVGDDDAEIREAAAYAACRAGAPASVFWSRWSIEDDPAVRASLALALGAADKEAAAKVLADACLNAPAPVRLAAAGALLRAGREWPDGAVGALVGAIDEGAEIAYCWTGDAEWYSELVEALPTSVAADALTQMLRSENPQTRQKAIWSLRERCEDRRSAPAGLLPMLAPVLRDPDAEVRSAAVSALRSGGRAAGRYAEILVDIARGYPAVAGQQRRTDEYQAIQTLVRLGDPRWVEPVCAAAVAGHRPVRGVGAARFTPEVLAEVRRWLARERKTANILAYALAEWGPRAAPAAPELVAALRRAEPVVAHALLAMGHDEPRAVPQLRSLVEKLQNLAAALAIQRITGEATVLFDLVRGIFAGRRRMFVPVAESMSELSKLGDALRPLVADARPFLTGTAARTHPQRDVQSLAARIVAATGEVDSAKPTIHAVLVGGETPARSAAELVADLARNHPALVADLAPALRDRLGDPWSRVAAARALATLGTPTSELVTPQVRGVGDYAGRFGLAAILELGAVETIPALEELFAADSRLVVAGSADDIVWDDEHLQEQIGSTIAGLRALGSRS